MNRKKIIEKLLISNFNDWQINVIDISKQHKGHNNFDGLGETHFSITLRNKKNVSFNRLSLHRQIYKILDDQFYKGLHALEIKITD